MDVLSDILSSLRLTGGVVMDAEMRGDFCVVAQFTPAHCAPFFPMPETLISYHYVRSGRLVVEVDGMAPVTLTAGGIAILPRNDPHYLASRSGLPATDAGDVTWVTDQGTHRIAVGNDGPRTEIWCGFLGTAKTNAHPLLDALPPMLTLNVANGQAKWLESSLRFVAEEHPSADVVARLAEIFLAQAVRDYVQLSDKDGGWLAALHDPTVARALAVIHRCYAEELDVERLAREAGASRTVLSERFTALLGEPPMRYCARWRMRLAANLLREGKQSASSVAYDVGFNSQAAFNRAFKREFGQPPAAWRRAVTA